VTPDCRKQWDGYLPTSRAYLWVAARAHEALCMAGSPVLQKWHAASMDLDLLAVSNGKKTGYSPGALPCLVASHALREVPFNLHHARLLFCKK
jgi:hypothetical protein